MQITKRYRGLYNLIYQLLVNIYGVLIAIYRLMFECNQCIPIKNISYSRPSLVTRRMCVQKHSCQHNFNSDYFTLDYFFLNFSNATNTKRPSIDLLILISAHLSSCLCVARDDLNRLTSRRCAINP